jgi:hypothetical protein
MEKIMPRKKHVGHRIRKVANDPLLNAMLEDERRRV